MDEHFLTTFAASVEHVCSAMLQLPVHCDLPALRIQGDPAYDVIGTIELTGDVSGLVAIKLPRVTAERLVTLFTGKVHGADDPGLVDAVGELVEMIAGDAKRGLGARSVFLSQPWVEVGAVPEGAADPSGIIVPCQTDCGSFQIELHLEETVHATADRSLRSA
jgi:chemotaxis protein CheX